MGRKSFAYHVMQYRRECIGTWMYKACDMNLSVLHWIATSLGQKKGGVRLDWRGGTVGKGQSSG
jgi:hypothetical protein